jgi:Domain of Unknown Function (DUF349)
MALLDRLRPQPGWKHSDPATRLAAVEALAPTEQALLASLAREDDAPRVRRAAVARLDDPETLGVIGQQDADDQVRADAIARLTKIAVEAVDPATGRRAVAALADERHLNGIARSAAPVEVCEAALDRITEAKALGAVARHAEHEAVRLRALTRLNDRAELEAVATHSDHKDVGLAALERLDDLAVLDTIAVRAKNKVIARRAKAIVKERAAAEAGTRAAAEALARRRGQLMDAVGTLDKLRDRARALSELTRLDEEWRALGDAPEDSQARWKQGTERVRIHCEDLARQEAAEAERRAAMGAAVTWRRALIEAAQSADDDTLVERLAAVRAEWAALEPVDGDQIRGLEREFDQACKAAESRAATRARAAATQQRLAELASEAAQLVESENLESARPRWNALGHEWRDLTQGLPVDAPIHAQHAGAVARWRQREQAFREAAARTAAENQTRLQEMADRATALSALPETPIKEIDRAVRDLRAAIDSPGPLPHGGEELLTKLKATLASLTPRLREARETDEWRRWANAGIQEELCKRMEALRGATDLAEASRQLRDLRRQWKAVSAAPKDEADALWQRFKTAGDEVQARVDTHLAAVTAEQTANLARKVALCEKAEALAQSTDWINTADILKALQAEWNKIGPVPKEAPALRDAAALKDAQAKEAPSRESSDVARRFRTACDTFFTRRKTDLAQRKGEWAQNQQKKEALCARMEALAESTDWAATFNEIKKLQAEWKTIGPVRRNRSEALWKRFRGACDRFFERYGKRHEIDLRHRVDEREAICRALEALAPAAMAAGSEPAVAVEISTVAAPSPQPDAAKHLEVGTLPAIREAPPAVAAEAQPDDPAMSAETPSSPAPVAPPADDAAVPPSLAPTPPGPPSPDGLVRTVAEAWRRWRQAPGLPSEALVPVRARFESALTMVLTTYASAFQGTPFDLDETRRRMKALCEDVENVTRGLPASQLGSTSVAALATLLKESLAANTIGGRVNEEAKVRAAAERVRRAQTAWRDLGPVPGADGHQFEVRFHRACRRFFEQHPEFDQPQTRDRHQRGHRGPRPQGGGPGGGSGSGRPEGRR